MSELFEEHGEKKVEYIELIYDLIFVYMIGRNNSLLDAVEGGFVSFGNFGLYLLSTLVILHIWYLSTLFVNQYGGNDLAQYIGLFVNMYLLYYMADGTRILWAAYYPRYCVAWGLILVNLAVQHFIRLRRGGGLMPWEDAHLKYNIRLLLVQAAIIFISIPVYLRTNMPFSWLSLVVFFLVHLFRRNVAGLMLVDFPHLTERVMLYVVFTFGEMIIGIAGYFLGEITFSSVYYSLMAFLIVAGLFLSYGFVYDHIVDRSQKTNGTGYMLAHIVIITALNNITSALEFMRKPEVAVLPKNIFLVVSFLLYFVFLFLLERWSPVRLESNRRFFPKLLIASAVFLILMGVFYQQAEISIAVSVLFIYAVFLLLHLYLKNVKKSEMEQ